LVTLASIEIAAPAPEIGSQFRDCRFHADAFGPSRGFPDSVLKSLQSFRRNHGLNLWTGAKAKSEELSFLRSRHRALGLIHFEFELLCDEPRYATSALVSRALWPTRIWWHQVVRAIVDH
jgi:hypothetical protein